MKCIVDMNLCTVINQCKQNAIGYMKDENEPFGGRIIFDYSKCNECGTCATLCCGKAIEMK
jgi:Pyruvate/2-oxoacid:ferredoxin oxidoreductase delta subunit